MKQTMLALVFFITNLCWAQQQDIVITIDDLPLTKGSYENFENIVHSFVKHKVPAIGFVIGKQINDETIKQLELFQKNGLTLGNHTYSHTNLRHMSASDYIDEIAKTDKILTPFMSDPKYFRYPYLGEGLFWQKSRVRNYLSEHHYIVAPVTIDSRDFEFNAELKKNPAVSLADLKKRYLDCVWQRTLTAKNNDAVKSGKQILLIHANIMNSYFLDDLLQMYEEHGYHFITLAEALKSDDNKA